MKLAWGHFASMFRITPPHTSDIAQFLLYWKHSTPFTHTDHMFFIIPCLVLWFSWTERNDCKHRNTNFLATRIIWHVSHYLEMLFLGKKLKRSHWQGISSIAEVFHFTFPPIMQVRPKAVAWQLPPVSWVKLNTDGALQRASGVAAGGGVFRDHHGKLLLAFCSPFVAYSSFEAEIQALCLGLHLARELGFQQLWIELDALAVVQLLGSTGWGFWRMQRELIIIRRIMKAMATRVSHIHREGNKPTDLLAAMGCSASQLQRFTYDNSPRQLLALIRMDQLGYPSFRFSKT